MQTADVTLPDTSGARRPRRISLHAPFDHQVRACASSRSSASGSPHARRQRRRTSSPAMDLGSRSSRPKAGRRPNSTPIPTVTPDPIRPIRWAKGLRRRTSSRHSAGARPVGAAARTISRTPTSSGCAAPDGSGTFFMPFGLDRPALIICIGYGSVARRMGPAAPVAKGGRRRRNCLRFDGIDEPLLLIPLAGRSQSPCQPAAGGEPGVGADRAREGERSRRRPSASSRAGAPGFRLKHSSVARSPSSNNGG